MRNRLIKIVIGILTQIFLPVFSYTIFAQNGFQKKNSPIYNTNGNQAEYKIISNKADKAVRVLTNNRNGNSDIYDQRVKNRTYGDLANGPWPMYQHDSKHTGRSQYAGPKTTEVNWICDIVTDALNSPASSQPVIGADGVIYLAVSENQDASIGKLYAFNPDGTIRWQSFDLEGDPRTPAIGRDSIIYVLTANGVVYAINSDGTERWKFYCAGGGISKGITIGPDGTIYIPSHPGLYALSPNGTQKWLYQEEYIWWGGGSPTTRKKEFLDVVVGPEGTIYAVFPGSVGMVDAVYGSLHALNPDGTVKWVRVLQGYNMGSPSVGPDGTIYVAGTYLYAYNPNDGGMIWKSPIYNVEGYYYYTALTPLITPNGTIIAGVYSWYATPFYILRAFSPQGEISWTFQPEEKHQFFQNPIIDVEGTVFIPWIMSSVSGEELTRIYWIDDNDGIVKDSLDVSGGVPGGSTAIGANSNLYIACVFSETHVENGWYNTYDLKLYAIGPQVLSLLEPPNGSHITSYPTFEWTPVQDALYYHLVVARDSTFYDIIWNQTSIPGDQTSITYNGSTLLEPGHTYYWKMRYQGNDLKWSNWTTPWSFTKESASNTLPAPALNTPINGSSVTLPEIFSWGAVSGASRYLLAIASDDGFGNVLWQGQSNATWINVPGGIGGIVNGNTYYWRVVAIDHDGNMGNYSDPFSFIKAETVSVPPPPTLLQPKNSSVVNAQTVTFSWTQSPGATNYTLQYSIDQDFPFDSDKTWTIRNLTSTSHSITLPPNTVTIYWKISASNRGGSSGWSTTSSFYYDTPVVQEVTSVVIDQPQSGEIFEQGRLVKAHAYFTGTYSGVILGNWWLDGQQWESFSVTMTNGKKCEFESPPLLTDMAGSHTIQVKVYSPSPLNSDSVTYNVIAGTWGPPAKLVLRAEPSIILTNGDTSTITVTIKDANNQTVYNFCDVVTFIITSGSGTLSSNPEVNATNGVASIKLTSTDRVDVIEVEASISSNYEVPNERIKVITTDSEIQPYLDPLWEYINRLKDMKLDLPYWSEVDLGRDYDLSGLEDFIRTKIEISSPEPADIEALKRLKLALEAIDHIYYHRFDPTHIDQCVEVMGAQMTVDNTIESIVQLSTLTLGSLARIEKIVSGKGLLKRALKLAVRGASKLITNMFEDAMNLAINRISDPWLRNVARQTNQLTFFSIKAAIDRGDALTDIISNVGIRLPADNLVLSNYVANTQAFVDQAVFYANHPDISITGKTLSAQTAVQLKISEVRAKTMEAKDKIDALQLGANIQGTLDLISLVPGIGTVVGIIAKVFQSGELLWTIHYGFDTYGDIFPLLEQAVQVAFQPDQQPGLKKIEALVDRGTHGLFTYASNKTLYKLYLQQVEENRESYESLLRKIIVAVECDNSQTVRDLLPQLIQTDDELSQTIDLATSPLVAASATASNTIAGFISAYDSTYVLSQNSLGQRAQLYGYLVKYLEEPSDPFVKREVIDQANLVLQVNNSANEQINSTVTQVFNVPASPLILVKSCFLADSVSVGDTLRVVAALINTGAGTAHDVSVTLYPDSLFSMISSDSIFVGDMNSGEEKELSWQIQVLPSALPDTAEFGWGLLNILPHSEDAIVLAKTLTISIYNQTNLTYNFPQQAWYMISLPIFPQDSTVSTLFPTALNGTAYYWNPNTKTYDAVTKIEPMKGYWIAISQRSSSMVSGIPINNFTEHFSSTGWYMVGSIHGNVNFIDPNDNPDGMVLTPAYTWDGSTGNYISADTLKEKTGYWVAVLGACDLTIDNTGSLAKAAKIGQDQQYMFFKQYGSTPPKPPAIDWETGEILEAPTKFALYQNYPNPFNQTTTIAFDLPKESHVEIVIYNVMGQKVAILVDKDFSAGSHEVLWNGMNDINQPVPSGVYLCRINAGEFRALKKLVLIR